MLDGHPAGWQVGYNPSPRKKEKVFIRMFTVYGHQYSTRLSVLKKIGKIMFETEVHWI